MGFISLRPTANGHDTCSVVWLIMPSKITLEKYDYMFASKYQLERVSWLQAGP